MKARLWRVRLELRDRLNKYLSERTESRGRRALPKRPRELQRITSASLPECTAQLDASNALAWWRYELTTCFISGNGDHSSPGV